MEFWNDLSKKVGDAANATVKGAEKLSGIAKIKYNISVKNAKLDKIFENIGRLSYDEYKNDVVNSEIIESFFLEAKAIEAEIASLNSELDEISNSRRCIECKAKLAKDMTFCPKCGAKQPESEENDESTVEVEIEISEDNDEE